LLRYSEEVLSMARSCREALDGDLDFYENDAALYISGEMDNYIPLVENAIDQCKRRVIQGEKVPASDKIVSIFEPHTDIICRGKTMSPAEFGHKVLVTSGASCLVTQYKVVKGNPGDNELFQNILEKHIDQFGESMDAFAADRRFYSFENERLATESPFNVKRVSIPKPGRRNAKRRAFEENSWFKKLQRFRAGIEGGLSTLIRSFGLGRCLWRGWESFKSWVGLSVFAYNLRKIAALS
jgi:IS5 family transposase